MTLSISAKQFTAFQWESGPWSSCPTQCSNSILSNRTRLVRCTDRKERRQVDAYHCDMKQKPQAEQRCRRHAHCPRWHKGHWGLCSKSCGGLGIARREVSCRVGRAIAGIAHQAVPDSECLPLESKPSETRKCGFAKCPIYHWRVGAWSKCIDPCKTSTQRRRVYCMSDTGKRAATRMCSSTKTDTTGGGGSGQPVEHRNCSTDKCPYRWMTGPWTTCSRTCGIGYKFRRIECKVRRATLWQQQPMDAVPTITMSNNNIKDNRNSTNTTRNSGNGIWEVDAEPTVLSRMCMSLEKPMVSAQCEMNPCNAEYYWSVGPWSQCSKNCGPGFRRRKVRCLDRNIQRAHKGKCNDQNQPKRREACFVQNCLPNDCAELREQNAQTGMLDGNYTVLVTGFRVTVYCRMMKESIPKTYLNVLPNTNFAEFYGKRLKNPYSCPYAGARNDSCACTNDGHVQAGLTRFSKVRVDLQNMKINPNDYTFAHTEYGNRIAFGTAGDCFSALNECPQGHFSIDLRGTGLRLVDDLQWISKGHRTSIRIDRSDNNAMVKGFCGGYCGECAPDRFKGIVVEVDQRQKLFVGLR